MARSTFARMGTMAILAVSTLAACDQTPTGNSSNGVVPTNVSFARGGNGGGKGPGSVSTQPIMAITPTQMSVSVGQQSVVSVTYWDSRGNVIPVTDAKPTYYGCRKMVETDADCWSVVSIVPGGTNNRSATITGKAAGTVVVYAADGLGTWVYSTVTVQ
jgi:hypothetical protein